MTARRSVAQGPAKVSDVALGALVLALLVGGCGYKTVLEYAPPYPLTYNRLVRAYDQAQLRTTSTLDVLHIVRDPQYTPSPKTVGVQLLNQSDTIVAQSAQSKDTCKTWFSLFAFHEHTMTTVRKYFLLMDERAVVAPSTKRPTFLLPPRSGLHFDCQVALPPDVLTVPYATDEARQIAVLGYVAGALKEDLAELSSGREASVQGNKILTPAGLMANQAFEAALLELGQSPVLAGQLGGKKGIAFTHLSLRSGRIRMTLAGDTATVRIRMNVPMN